MLLEEVLRPPPLEARRAVEVFEEPLVFLFAVAPLADEVVRFVPDFADVEVVRFDPDLADADVVRFEPEVVRFDPAFADEVFRADDFAPPEVRLDADFAPPELRLELDFEPPEDFLAVDFDPPPDVVLFAVERELDELVFLEELDRELAPDELPFFAVDFPPEAFRAVAFPPALAAFFVGVLEEPVDFLAELLLLPELDVFFDVLLLPDDLLDADLDLDPLPVDADFFDEAFEAVFFFVVAILVLPLFKK